MRSSTVQCAVCACGGLEGLWDAAAGAGAGEKVGSLT